MHNASLSQNVSALCSALSHPQRVGIVLALRNGELDVTALCDALGCSQSRTSQQLALLRKEGVVVPRRDGRHVYYRLSDSRTVEWANTGSTLSLSPSHLSSNDNTAA